MTSSSVIAKLAHAKQVEINKLRTKLTLTQKIALDNQDRYHGVLEENKKLRELLKEAAPWLEDHAFLTAQNGGALLLLKRIQEVLK